MTLGTDNGNGGVYYPSRTRPDMVEVIAISVAVVIVLLGVMYAVPRFVSGEDGWPDFLAMLDGCAVSWMNRSRIWDAVVAILTLVVLAIAIGLYQDPATLGEMAESAEFVAHILGILGFVGLFATAYVSVRRAGLPSAEATLIGSSLVGIVLMVLVVALLLQ